MGQSQQVAENPQRGDIMQTRGRSAIRLAVTVGILALTTLGAPWSAFGVNGPTTAIIVGAYPTGTTALFGEPSLPRRVR
jgi:hypothetical protein